MRRYPSAEIGFSILFFLLGLSTVFFDIQRKQQVATALRIEDANAEAFEAENDTVQEKEKTTQLTFTDSQSAWVQIKPFVRESLESALIRYQLSSEHARQISHQVNYFAKAVKSVKPITIFLHQKLGSSNIECDQAVFFTPGMQKGTMRLQKGKFYLTSAPVGLPRTAELHTGVVKKNFYSDAQRSSVDHSLIEQSMMIFRHVLDFQRDVCVGDSFTILSEKSYDKETGFVGDNTLLYSAINLRNRKLSAYRFVSRKDTKGGSYLDESSLPLQREFLVTPVRGARISSRYGKRKHPIRGYTRFHPGVDFAARTGTPVLASGHGYVKKMGKTRGYGNVIILIHDRQYATLYAHLHSFANALKVGKYVQQGAVIGYVGSTGESTGPHLHYEVRAKGKCINPQKVNKLPPEPLKGVQYELFIKQKSEIDRKLSLLRSA